MSRPKLNVGDRLALTPRGDRPFVIVEIVGNEYGWRFEEFNQVVYAAFDIIEKYPVIERAPPPEAVQNPLTKPHRRIEI